MEQMFSHTQKALPEADYASDMLREAIGRRVIVVLNFSGEYPPERRSFFGNIIAVGRDYFILTEGRTKNHLMAYFVNLAYVTFVDNYRNLHEIAPPPPASPPPIQHSYTPRLPHQYGWTRY